MRRGGNRTLAFVILTILSAESQPLCAQEPGDVANTSIVWFGSDLSDKDFDDFITKIPSKQRESNLEAVYDGLKVLIWADDPASTKQLFDTFDPEFLKVIDAITGDTFVSLLDKECSGKQDLPRNTTDLPPGVDRVHGGTGDWSGNDKGRVWIIDSGVDNSSGLLNILGNLAVNCVDQDQNAGVCPSAGSADYDDDVGHGTMIAGIIGASLVDLDNDGQADDGISGVAPKAKIVPVKAFDSRGRSRLSAGPLAALNHVWNKATVNDVVNISWGTDWVSVLRKQTLDTVAELNKRVHKLADKGLKVVIAAGNASPDHPNWVAFVSPAASGSYVSTNGSGGEVRTVSAVISEKDAQGQWKPDQFWPGSNFGIRPPDFAEPGRDILSLWPGGSKNKARACSGTSFAAAHLAGIYVRGTPKMEGQANGDPDGQPDPVGVCCQ